MTWLTVVTDNENNIKFQGSQIDSGIYMVKQDANVDIIDNHELVSENLKGIRIYYTPVRFCGLEYSSHRKGYINFGNGCGKVNHVCRCN